MIYEFRTVESIFCISIYLFETYWYMMTYYFQSLFFTYKTVFYFYQVLLRCSMEVFLTIPNKTIDSLCDYAK